MAKSLDPIYGSDDNDFALGIASDALQNTSGKEDVWGARIDQSARSKGASDEVNNDVAVISNKSDSRAKSAGNHGKQD